jgi:penicillin-binding protein 1A
MREALSKSLNLVSIRLLRAIGIPYARSYLERFGLDMSRFSASLTMALGSGGVTPLEMLSAYGTLANTGYQVKPYFISYVTDRDGQVIYQAPVPEYCDACYAENLNKPSFDAKAMVAEFLEEQESLEQLDEILEPPVVDTPDTEEVIETYDAPRVMTRSNNFLTVSMLKDVVRLGTARKALALNRQDLAGKTGTTNDYIDAWFSGFNSQVATTVWVGFDEPASMGRGEAGSVAALPIWVDYMSDALKEVPHDNQEPPSWIEQGLVNRETGVRTNEEDPDAVIEYFPIEALLEYPSQEFTQDQVDIEQDRAVLKGLLTRASKLPAEDENHPVDQLIDEQLELTSEEALLNTSPTLPEPENPGRIIEEQEDTEGLF